MSESWDKVTGILTSWWQNLEHNRQHRIDYLEIITINNTHYAVACCLRFRLLRNRFLNYRSYRYL